MAEIKDLEYTYSKDYREVFEDIANLMFCTELGLEKGVNKRINQRDIESDPVKKDEKCYAYQAKYYDASTNLPKHRKELIDSIKGASLQGVTDLYFFINKDKPDKISKTGKEPKYIEEIENVAIGCGIKLHWWTKSKIESSLDMPKFTHIKNLYFDFGKNIRNYYDYVVELYEKPNTGNTLLGEESLSELYMQPSYYKSEGETGDVEQLFDEFISEGTCGVLWIAGEPGHGKTSMCIKAVADYVNGKRYQQARGVFWFRLNPQGIPNMVGNKSLALENVFSWGRIDGNRSNTIDPCEIEGSLVFIDGFDELKSSLEIHGVLDNQFYTQVNQLAEAYQMHIVVTSRTRALEQVGSLTEYQLRIRTFEITCNLSDGGVLKNNVMLLSPLTEEKQTAWINELISLRENKGINTSDLEDYKHTFQALQENEDIAGLLKIPILLRMIVQNCFEPSSDNRVELYRELFDKTLLRQGLGDQRKRLHSIYQELAFRIFVYDDDCTELNEEEIKEINYNNAYLYQYYLYTPEVRSGKGKADTYRITFIHRSFYQYFLSEFVYEKLKAVTDDQSGENFLKYLWPRHMDSYVLDNLRLLAKDKEIDCMQVLKSINETDAILTEHENYSSSRESIGNYDKANNVFWNAISVCNSIFLFEDSQKNMEITERVIELMTKYTCSGILLRNSYLFGANLSGANLSGANLNGADLREADLREANLFEADLSGADLREAELREANLFGANLSKADLIRADLFEATLCEADLREANLSEADLSGANLSKVDLSEAYLSGANLSASNLSEADLSEADLSEADLYEAYLSGADLREANLSEANLIKADLCGADLTKADLSGSNLSEANLSGSSLYYAKLDDNNMFGANMEDSLVSKNLYNYISGQNVRGFDEIIWIDEE